LERKPGPFAWWLRLSWPGLVSWAFLVASRQVSYGSELFYAALFLFPLCVAYAVAALREKIVWPVRIAAAVVDFTGVLAAFTTAVPR